MAGVYLSRTHLGVLRVAGCSGGSAKLVLFLAGAESIKCPGTKKTASK